jgi:DNA repair protein RecO (recombination protein O)
VIISSIRGRKSKFSMNMVQALSLVEMEIYYHQNRDIHRVREMSNYIQYQSIPFDIIKRTQAMFIAEILYKALREEETNRQLYDFLEYACQVFDLQERNTGNFHMVFLINLSKYLGFFPQDNYSTDNCLFDLRNGHFTVAPVMHPDFLNKDLSEGLHDLLGVNMKEADDLKMGYGMRVGLISAIIDYYSLHIHDFGRVQSMDVLKEVLR